MLEVKNIKKYFGGVKAVDDISFSIKLGKITALIGPNGAGKTTLFDIIAGLVRPDSGQIVFADKEITKLEPYQRANLGISRIFQQVRLFRNLNIAEHLRMAQDNNDTKFWLNIFSFGKSDLKKYQEWLLRFGLNKSLMTRVSYLSYGQRKLLQIAMALFRPHQLLMLDEPVAGVNAVAQDQIERMLLVLKQQGETIILIDHDMNFIRRLADEVIVLDAGRVLLNGEPEYVLNDPKVIEAYLGK